MRPIALTGRGAQFYRIARTETLDDASDAAAATVAADGDNDHVTNADPSPPPVRKRAERTRRAA